MANQPGLPTITRFRPGQPLSAADLNRIVDGLLKRIIGGKGIRVRAFGGRIIIERTDA